MAKKNTKSARGRQPQETEWVAVEDGFADDVPTIEVGAEEPVADSAHADPDAGWVEVEVAVEPDGARQSAASARPVRRRRGATPEAATPAAAQPDAPCAMPQAVTHTETKPAEDGADTAPSEALDAPATRHAKGDPAPSEVELPEVTQGARSARAGRRSSRRRNTIEGGQPTPTAPDPAAATPDTPADAPEVPAQADETPAPDIPAPALAPMDEFVAELQRLSVPELVKRHVEALGKRPRIKNRTWLQRKLAWHEQTRRFGGLSNAAKARLDELMGEIQLPEPRPATERVKLDKPRSADELPVGTRVERQYRGRLVVATRIEGGWTCDGSSYASLSAVAKAVSGTHCSGPAFFGLRARKEAGQ